ncbi:hypothetical protein SAMN05421755_10532 [Nitrosomonas sp. Nm33]|nr:hypothetical protein SAMN05421755_10532 [Nitrosomonas sp. Nm33]
MTADTILHNAKIATNGVPPLLHVSRWRSLARR